MSKATFEIVEADRIEENFGAVGRPRAANLIGGSIDYLEDLEERGEGPPRFQINKRWFYPLLELRRWQERRLAEAGYKPESTKRRQSENAA